VSEHDPTKCNTWHGWRVSERLAGGGVLAVLRGFRLVPVRSAQGMTSKSLGAPAGRIIAYPAGGTPMLAVPWSPMTPTTPPLTVTEYLPCEEPCGSTSFISSCALSKTALS